MGAWGFGIWENDSALDIRGDFNYYLAEEGKTPKEALELIETDEDYVVFGWCVLALADLQIEHLGKLTPKIKKQVKQVIIDELEDNTEYVWTDEVERKEAIREFTDKVEKYL